MSDGRKNGKLRLDYISPISLVALAQLMTDAEVKKGYKPHDWIQNTSIMDLISAAKRHLLKMELGENVDEETGALHSTCVMFAGMALTHIMSMSDYEDWEDRGSLGTSGDFPAHEEWLTGKPRADT